MMTFDEHREYSKKIVLHYANRLDCSIAKSVVAGKAELTCKKDAEELAYFFWEMTDKAVDDEENERVIEGISDLQSWLEKALHIFMGYFKSMGYAEEWKAGYEKCHSE